LEFYLHYNSWRKCNKFLTINPVKNPLDRSSILSLEIYCGTTCEKLFINIVVLMLHAV
jgi:hypothetical protein